MNRFAPVVLLALGLLAVPAPAEAAACSGGRGVTVVVQFGDGPTQVGCAAGDPRTGYAALTAAGFKVTYAQGSGAGAICRIDSYPGNNNCGAMPPTDAYWAYFHAQPGGRWSYSDEGGGTYDPQPGTVEGWRFKGDERTPPDLKPPVSVTKPTPSATPTKKPAKKPTKVANPTVSATPTPTPSSTPSSRPTKAATPTAPAPSQTPSSVLSTPAAAQAPTREAPAPEPDKGISWVWGVLLLGVLAAAGGATAVVRRRG